MSSVGWDVAAWAGAHGASFDVAPLVEMVKGRQVQVGFTLGLYARLPVESGPGPEREAAAVTRRLTEMGLKERRPSPR